MSTPNEEMLAALAAMPESQLVPHVSPSDLSVGSFRPFPSREPSLNPFPSRESSLNTAWMDVQNVLMQNAPVTNPPDASVTHPIGLPCDSHVSSFAGLRVIIDKHCVHKTIGAETETPDYIVTNLKVFQVDVALVNANNELVQDKTLKLQAVLFYENGSPVSLNAGHDERALKGETEAMIINGRATFKLQAGKTVTTHLMSNQRFRVRIEPTDQSVRASCPALASHSAPFRVMTKIDRKPPSSREPAPSARPAKVARASAAPAQNAPVATGVPGGAEIHARLQQQRKEIQMLTTQNAGIMRELATLRKLLTAGATAAGAPETVAVPRRRPRRTCSAPH